MTVQMDLESHRFQAEAAQILDLMINSLYSNKEIFLRELISNASDAIDRLRLELLSRSELPEAEGPLRIRVSYDKDAGTITVADNGIGMSHDEVIENIGTIAKSGTREFLQSLTGDQRKDAALIGQFGVGFYSSFIVAERVVLTTRRAGLEASEGVRWESDGKGEYTLETIERPDRGTTIVLHLREGEDDLLNGYRLRSIIEKYSDHISVPILMPGEPEDKAAEADGGGPPAGGDRQPGLGAVDPPKERAHRPGLQRLLPSTSSGSSPIRWPGCTARSRVRTSTRCCCSSRPARHMTCGSTDAPWHPAACAAGSSSWRTPGICCRPTCGSSAA